MSSLVIGRLVLGQPPNYVQEAMGDPISSLGGAVVPAQRKTLDFTWALATYFDGTTSIAQGQTLRRQMRSMFNNTPLKMQGFLYIQYADDTEQNGWYVPGDQQLQGIDDQGWKGAAMWKMQGTWSLLGHRRTHREAREVWLKDLSTGLYERDALETLVSSDFANLQASSNAPITIVTLPPSASNYINPYTGRVPITYASPAGRDGVQGVIAVNLSDLDVIAFDRADSSMGQGDVVVYDRRQQFTGPVAGPDTSWEEAYGQDHEWSWLAPAAAIDAPVLDNMIVRVRFDATNGDGFRIDCWNGTQYVEQGKMVFYREGDANAYLALMVSASLHSWTPERATIKCVFTDPSNDQYANDTIFVTVTRGRRVVRFEQYPSLLSNGNQATAYILWYPVAGDFNADILKLDTVAGGSGAAYLATTVTVGGTGPNIPGSVINVGFTAPGTFTGENWMAMLRSVGDYKTVSPFQVNFAVMQANASANLYGDLVAYGTLESRVGMRGPTSGGYMSAHIGFVPTVADQISEAESIRNGGSGTASQVSDATASGGLAVKDTQAAQNSNTLSKHTALLQAKYRMCARLRVGTGVTASATAYLQTLISGGTNIQFLPILTGLTNTAWQWFDFGEVIAPSALPWFTLNAWVTGGTAANGVFIDRVVLFLVEDRATGSRMLEGARDMGQAILYDSRMLGALVTR